MSDYLIQRGLDAYIVDEAEVRPKDTVLFKVTTEELARRKISVWQGGQCVWHYDVLEKHFGPYYRPRSGE